MSASLLITSSSPPSVKSVAVTLQANAKHHGFPSANAAFAPVDGLQKALGLLLPKDELDIETDMKNQEKVISSDIG